MLAPPVGFSAWLDSTCAEPLSGRSKLERRAAHELIARYRRAPVPLDVRDHLLVAPQMPAWISMIGVRQVSTEDWPLPAVHQLPDSVRTTKHASVEVDIHDNHVLDLAFLEERQQLPPSSVTASVDEISMHSI